MWLVLAVGCDLEEKSGGGETETPQGTGTSTTRPAPTSTSEGCRTRQDTGTIGHTGDTGYDYTYTYGDTGGGCG
jgi:hypothetical protein